MTSSISIPVANRPLWLAAAINYGLMGLLVLVLGVRLSFLGTGALTFPDEDRYYRSVEAVEALVYGGDLDGFCARLAETQGRPGDALWRVAPASLQVLAKVLTGVDVHDPASLLIPVSFNYLITLGSMLLFYRIGRLLLRHKPAALLSTLVYSCLVNTNLYVRHVFPYDAAMLCFFGAVYLALRVQQQPERGTVRACFGIGALAAFTFAVYPGYSFTVAVAGLLLVLRPLGWRSFFQTGFFYVLGVAAVLLLFELLVSVGGRSYYEDCLKLSVTIQQGDFEEGFSFLFNYLFEAEQSLGYLLTGLGVLAGPVVLFRLFRGGLTGPQIGALLRHNALFISMVLAYLAYAVNVYYLEKMVFYGRILHFYLPVLVLLLAKALCPPPGLRWQVVPLGVVAGIACYSFAVFARQYHSIVYPVAFLNQHAPEFEGANVTSQDQNRTADISDYYRVRGPLTDKPAQPGRPNVVLVNLAFMYPIQDAGWCNEIKLPASYKLLYTGPHFLNLPAYPFEGFRASERAIIKRCHYQCQVYEQP